MGTPNKKLTKRQIVGYSIVAFIVLGFMASVMCPVDKPISKTVQSEPIRYTEAIPTPTPAPTPTPLPLEIQKQVVLSFQKYMQEIEEPNIIWHQQYIEDGLEGKNIYECYDIFNTAQFTYLSASQAFKRVLVPEGLSEDVTEYLEGYRDNMWMAYRFKSQWAELSKEFLDDNKPSTLQKAKDMVAKTNQWTLYAARDIALAKKEVGLLEGMEND